MLLKSNMVVSITERLDRVFVTSLEKLRRSEERIIVLILRITIEVT